MSKSQQSRTYNQAGGQVEQNAQNMGSANTQLQSTLSNAESNASNLLPGITAGYSDIASNGGGVNSIADSTYTNLANTGGISPSQSLAMQDQASEAAQSTYQTGLAQAQRTAAATGGYGDTSAVQANLARTGGQAAATATTNELASITGMQQQGEIAGAGGLASEQQNLTSNKLAGLAGSSNIYGMNQSQISTTLSQILQNYQQTGALSAQDMAIMTNLSEQPGVFANIVSSLGTLGGAAGSVLQGINT